MPAFNPTPAQKNAITHPPAPLMILAGAGTGKTTTLLHRIAHLIRQGGLAPGKILVLTFTEKATAELRQRIRELDSAVAEQMTITTFHAFCYQAVLEFRPAYRTRRLMNDGDILFLLREHYGELDQLRSEVFRREPLTAIQAFRTFFDRLRDDLIEPGRFPELLQQSRENIASAGEDDWEERFRQLEDHCAAFPLFQEWKGRERWVDYGDMVYACWQLLENDPAVRAALQERYHTIVVDEFQDNNYALNRMLAILSEIHQSITVVGDDDQCIYSFRGASAYNINDFHERYHQTPHYGQAVLEVNHRSTQPILDLANEVIRHNSGRQAKRLRAPGGKTGPKPVLAVGSTGAQVAHMTQGIEDLLARGGLDPGDIAVLVRTNRQAQEVVAGLARRDIATHYVQVSFFELPAIRTALAWGAVAADTPSGPMGLHRILRGCFPRQTGELLPLALDMLADDAAPPDGLRDLLPDETRAALRRIIQQIKILREEAETLDAGELLWRIMEISGLFRQHFDLGYYENQAAIENLALLLELAQEFAERYAGKGLARFMQYLGVLQEADAIRPRIPPLRDTGGAIQVMTVHAAKGLEFPVVFIPFAQSARFPTNYRPSRVIQAPPPQWRAWQTGAQPDERTAHLEEERRLFYVAITRAKRQLTILTTPKRRSPFVRNLPEALMDERPIEELVVAREPDQQEQLRLDLKRRLARELLRSAYEKAHELVEAIRLVDQYAAGLAPDLDDHPLGRELAQRLGLLPEPITTPTDPALTLSASAISRYETCPLQYRFARIDHIPGKEDKPAATFGKIIHAALEALHRPAGQGLDQPLEPLLDAVWSSDGFTYPQEEAQHRADALALLQTYLDRLGGQPPPTLAVEQSFAFQLGNVNVRGRIDRIDQDEGGRLRLIDYKTSRRKLSAKEAREDPQMALYALYIGQADEVNDHPLSSPSNKLELTYYFLRADEPEVTIAFQADELDACGERVAAVARGIRAGEFPHNRGYHCNYCDYKNLICPAWEQEQL